MAHVRQPERQTHSQRDREGDLVGKNSSWFVKDSSNPISAASNINSSSLCVHGPQVSFTLSCQTVWRIVMEGRTVHDHVVCGALPVKCYFYISLFCLFDSFSLFVY